jgi:superfamily II DNA helicase RecQ
MDQNYAWKQGFNLTKLEYLIMAQNVDQNFVLVLPTGGGKSLVFTLPAMHEKGHQTFVVVPNKALLTDQKQGAHKVGLTVDHWTAKKRRIDADAQLVMLAVESAGTDYFRQ